MPKRQMPSNLVFLCEKDILQLYTSVLKMIL